MRCAESKIIINTVLLLSGYVYPQDIGKPYIIKTMLNGTIVIDTCYPRTEDEIKTYVNSKLNNIREIYDYRNLGGMQNEGKIEVEFLIGRFGNVIDQKILSNGTGDTILANSLLKEIHEWQFNETHCPGAEQIIIYPFMFGIPKIAAPHDGTYKTFYENGKIKEEGNVKNGKQIGEWISYHENGIKAALINYSNGKKHGNSYLWNENGIKIASFVYKNGLNYGEWLTYYINGQKNILSYWKEGQKDSCWIEWYENGKIKTEVSFKNDKENGPYKAYYANGSIAIKGNYIHGKKTGVFEEWYQDGLLLSEKIYRNDSLIKVMKKK